MKNGKKEQNEKLKVRESGGWAGEARRWVHTVPIDQKVVGKHVDCIAV